MADVRFDDLAEKLVSDPGKPVDAVADMYRHDVGHPRVQARKAGAAGRPRFRLLALATVGLMLASGWAFAQQTEDTRGLTRFDVPAAGAAAGQGTFPQDITATGAIAGYYVDDDGNHGFLRAPDGTITTFDAPGAGTGTGQGTFPFGMNPAGAIAGGYSDKDGVVSGFLRAPDGRITTFTAPGAGTGAGQGTVANNINPVGEIAGDYVDTNGEVHGLLRAPNGAITEFNAPGAGTGNGQGTYSSYPCALTPAGEYTAEYVDARGVFHGFVRAPDGTISKFDAPGAGTVKGSGQGTYAFSINPSGTITGGYQDTYYVSHGFLRAPDGTITTFDAPDAGNGAGQGTIGGACINPSGAIVGYYVDGSGVNHGFVRAPYGAFTEFDVKGAGTGPNQGTFALSNNPAGTVAGYYVDTNNVAHGFAGTPTKDPSAVMVVGAVYEQVNVFPRCIPGLEHPCPSISPSSLPPVGEVYVENVAASGNLTNVQISSPYASGNYGPFGPIPPGGSSGEANEGAVPPTHMIVTVTGDWAGQAFYMTLSPTGQPEVGSLPLVEQRPAVSETVLLGYLAVQ